MIKKFLNLSQKSLVDLGAASYKDLWEKNSKDYAGFEIDIKTTFKKGEDSENVFHFIFSTDSEDRHGEIVKQNSDLKAFKKNPVILDSHNYDSIEHIIGKALKINTNKEEGFTDGAIEFFIDNPKGLLAKKGVEQEFINATSIGFIPKEFDEKGNILKWELLEVSLVSVPANAEALREKSKKAAQEGDECDMGDGNMGEMHPNDEGKMVCMPKKTKAQEGDECQMDDGNMGEMHPNDDGQLVCMPKKEKKITEQKTKTASEIIAEMATKQKKELKVLAKEVDEFVNHRRVDKKRKIHQIIRGLIGE